MAQGSTFARLSRTFRRAGLGVLVVCLVGMSQTGAAAVVPETPGVGPAAHDTADQGAPPPVPPDDDLAPLRAFRTFTRQNTPNLPQNSVATLLDDDEGVMWLGTLDGLASFDGGSMWDEAARSGTPQLGAVYALARRGLGGVYVGGTAGLHARDRNGAWRYLGDGRAVASVAEDTPGSIWVVDQQGGLFHVTDSDRTTWQAVALPAGAGTALAVAVSLPAGTVWVAAHGAVFRAGSGGLVRAAAPPANQRYTALHATTSGGAIVGTSSGTFVRVDPTGAAAAEEACRPGVVVTAVTEDWRQRIWAGCADGRVSVGWPGQRRALWGANEGMRMDVRVNALTFDRHGSMWMGRNGYGATQLVSERWRHRTHWSGTERQVPGESVFGVTPTPDGGALIAAFARGIWQWDGHSVREIGADRGLTENVRCTAAPSPDLLWVGGRRGLFEARGRGRFTKVLPLEDGFVNALRQGPDGTWYALTSVAGLWARRGGVWVPEATLNSQLPHLNIRGMAWQDRVMWLATAAGPVRVQNNVVTRVGNQGPGHVMTNAVLVLPSGDVWVAAMGGISIWHTNTWTHLTEADGLPGRTVYSLALAPDGAVWAGGSAGVGRFKDGRWSRITRTTGLIEDECTLEGLAVLRDGRVLVGTLGSLAVYSPSEPEPPAAPLALHWRDVPPPGPDGIVRLPKGQREIPLRWSAPWLTGENVEYRVHYAERGQDYSPPTTRTDFRIGGLPPGVVRFAVQARVGGAHPGPWTAPLTLSAEVPPYFYETWWARLAATALLFSVFPLGIRIRTARLVRRQRELQAAVDAAVADVRTLRGLIPICASCKRVRDDRGSWNQLEAYLNQHSDATVSHGICPDCMTKLYPEYKS